MTESSLPTVIEQVFAPLVECLTPEVARQIDKAALNPSTTAKIEFLAEKANEGTLTARERSEYRHFVECLDLLAIIKAMIRERLSKSRM